MVYLIGAIIGGLVGYFFSLFRSYLFGGLKGIQLLKRCFAISFFILILLIIVYLKY